MLALGADIPVGGSSDSEEERQRLVLGVDVTDDEYPAAPGLKRKALSFFAIVTLAVLLFFALYTHFSGATYEVAAALKDATQLQDYVQIGPQSCPGFHIPGLGRKALVNAGNAHNPIMPTGNWLTALNGGRAYFADQCVDAPYYNNNYYTSYFLLGNTIAFTVDLNGAGCGCNVAFYFVSMKQNANASTCGDYYCDANSVCGVPCAEVDLMEANMYSWHVALHTQDDAGGHAAGYGGFLVSSWSKDQYGPGGTCIDTGKPFDVAVGFPVAGNTLQSVEVRLSQAGSPCPLSTSISNYPIDGRNGILEMSQAMAAGMTPVVSYWTSEDLDWLDGMGWSPRSSTAGVCTRDTPLYCPKDVKMYSFHFLHGVHTHASEPQYTRQNDIYCSPWQWFDAHPRNRYTTLEACKRVCNAEPECVACNWNPPGPYALLIWNSWPCTPAPSITGCYLDLRIIAR